VREIVVRAKEVIPEFDKSRLGRMGGTTEAVALVEELENSMADAKVFWGEFKVAMEAFATYYGMGSIVSDNLPEFKMKTGTKLIEDFIAAAKSQRMFGMSSRDWLYQVARLFSDLVSSLAVFRDTLLLRRDLNTTRLQIAAKNQAEQLTGTVEEAVRKAFGREDEEKVAADPAGEFRNAITKLTRQYILAVEMDDVLRPFSTFAGRMSDTLKQMKPSGISQEIVSQLSSSTRDNMMTALTFSYRTRRNAEEVTVNRLKPYSAALYYLWFLTNREVNAENAHLNLPERSELQTTFLELMGAIDLVTDPEKIEGKVAKAVAERARDEMDVKRARQIIEKIEAVASHDILGLKNTEFTPWLQKIIAILNEVRKKIKSKDPKSTDPKFAEIRKLVENAFSMGNPGSTHLLDMETVLQKGDLIMQNPDAINDIEQFVRFMQRFAGGIGSELTDLVHIVYIFRATAYCREQYRKSSQVADEFVKTRMTTIFDASLYGTESKTVDDFYVKFDSGKDPEEFEAYLPTVLTDVAFHTVSLSFAFFKSIPELKASISLLKLMCIPSKRRDIFCNYCICVHLDKMFSLATRVDTSKERDANIRNLIKLQAILTRRPRRG
jgi:hypothetical protein